jgi:Raf kinase inhibitor-like YbhB/YbcL family protein
MPSFGLASPAFDDGDPIPQEYGYTERNVNPPLEVDGVPTDAASLAIVMDDPDALEPAGKIWDHWVLWNVPVDIGTIPEGYDPKAATEGRNDFGEPGYGGPNPPDGRHTYRFVAYALDTTFDLPTDATKADLETAIDGHVLAEARLAGTYSP